MKDMEEELQQAVKKEVEKRVKEGLERIQDEVKASVKEELGKLTSFGDRLQSLEGGLKESGGESQQSLQTAAAALATEQDSDC